MCNAKRISTSMIVQQVKNNWKVYHSIRLDIPFICLRICNFYKILFQSDDAIHSLPLDLSFCNLPKYPQDDFHVELQEIQLDES
jgi:hypothetical protein